MTVAVRLAPTRADLQPLMDDGWIHATRHPSFPYTIYNYTHKAENNGHWTPETLAARALILDDDDNIVTLTMPRFFNFGAPDANGLPTEPQNGPFEVLTKLDGWFAGMLRSPDNTRISWSTRGSFSTIGGIVANNIWHTRYRSADEALCSPDFEHLSLMAEILSEKTRIVCSYEKDDLVLIAARDRFTGRHLSHKELLQIGGMIGMPCVERVPLTSFEDALLAREVLESNKNAEGFVLHWPDTGFRLKLKTRQYFEMSRMLRTLRTTRKMILQAWRDNDTERLQAYRQTSGQKAQQVVDDTVRDLNQRLGMLTGTVEIYATHAFEHAKGDRRAFAMWTKTYVPKHLIPLVFTHWEGKRSIQRGGRRVDGFRQTVLEQLPPQETPNADDDEDATFDS